MIKYFILLLIISLNVYAQMELVGLKFKTHISLLVFENQPNYYLNRKYILCDSALYVYKLDKTLTVPYFNSSNFDICLKNSSIPIRLSYLEKGSTLEVLGFFRDASYAKIYNRAIVQNDKKEMFEMDYWELKYLLNNYDEESDDTIKKHVETFESLANSTDKKCFYERKKDKKTHDYYLSVQKYMKALIVDKNELDIKIEKDKHCVSMKFSNIKSYLTFKIISDRLYF